MRRALPLLTALAVAACSSDAEGVDADAIDQAEFAAVQYTLGQALAEDTLYPTLATLVFPFVDRAERLVDVSGNTTRLVGIELDIDVVDDQGSPLAAQFTAVLGWTGYRPATRTVDTVFLVLGAGRAPVNDVLGDSFSPDEPGSGTAIVMHQAADSTVTAWQTGAGQLMTTSSSYSGRRSQTIGGGTFSWSRGTVSGDFAITNATETGGGASTVSTARNFSGGTQAVLIEIDGSFSF